MRDNRGLRAALEAGPTAAVYIATPLQWLMHDDAPIKQDLWRRTLGELRDDLLNRGLRLFFLQVPDYGAVPAALTALCRDLQITALHCNREYPLNERRRDEAVAQALGEVDVACHLHDDRLLVRPERILNGQGEPFKIFTPWARRAREHLSFTRPPDIDELSGQHDHAGAFADVRTGRTVDLTGLDWPTPQSFWARMWPAGELAALSALADFTEARIRDYRQQRDYPALNGTSCLSPYLACGSLSNRQCWRQAGADHEGQGMEAWRTELLWRDFYQYVMLHFPHVCKGWNWRRDMEDIPWRQDEEAFNAWCEGMTGYPVVDAAMRQLKATGWMHNRLRMVTAMFLSKTLLINWRRGEQWFMRHLVDGEFAANNGGWQWSASTGTDAVPYFRIFNPVTQSRRFDARGDFLRRYVPELTSLGDKSIHDPGLLRPADYPPPIVDLKSGRERALAAFSRQPQSLPDG